MEIESPGEVLEKLPADNLRKIEDLLWLDGPVLSLFRDSEARAYFYLWVDADEHYNRWLIFKLEEEVLTDYLSDSIDLRSAILKEQSVWLADIDGDANMQRIFRMNSAELPEPYLPEEGYFHSN